MHQFYTVTQKKSCKSLFLRAKEKKIGYNLASFLTPSESTYG